MADTNYTKKDGLLYRVAFIGKETRQQSDAATAWICCRVIL